MKNRKIGNPDLANACLHTVKLEYIFDWQRNGHNIIFNVNGGYIRGDGLIEAKDYAIYDNLIQEEGGKPSLVYTIYENTGISNIATANMSVIYTYILTLTVCGNLFSKTMLKNNEREHFNYYNIGLAPIFNFKGDWVLSSRFIYNSAIERRNMNRGQVVVP